MTTPYPPQKETADGAIDEYEKFCDLVAGLTPEQWDAPTRCEGWAVRDVAGHVFGVAVDITDRASGQRSADDQAAAYRGLKPAALAEDLRGKARALRGPFAGMSERSWTSPGPMGYRRGESVLLLLQDTYVHADDIRAALGLPSDRGPGLAATVDFVRFALERRGADPARFVLEGVGTVEVGEGGPEVHGDPLDFVLVGTGRKDPAACGLDTVPNIYG
ncbi:maleylpyruvate isomerase family mycothiol-dependent enzyme [Nocardiopsis sp. CNT312]|uniref:maleylpyruvate isomerase family mycothiol-dependent enzyme n=1 Tax=Nocardiopsis sp. CNT312 TaxID=1137268 RepID=UPI00049181E0|nr:maleylpyruvate isomerase family mycothiol-dependent enzyme [Nocardiopsis sp. CNT312]